MDTKSDRDQWIDVLRGVAIVLVALGHALRGIEAAGLPTGAALHALEARLYAVHVPLLFFVSGLVVAQALGRHGARPFARGRLGAILWPMILWTYVFLGVKLIAGPYQNEPIEWAALLAPPIPGQLHLWFLWALFLMHMLVALIWAATPARGRTAAFAALFAAAVVGTTVALPGAVDHWAGMAIRYLPYFALGLVVGLGAVPSRLEPQRAAVAALVAVGAFLLAPQLGARAGFAPVPSLLACLGAYFSASIVLSFPVFVRVAAYLGVSAMAIYVLHTIFSAGVRETLLLIGVETTATHLALGVVAGVAIPVLLREACLRVRVARPLALA